LEDNSAIALLYDLIFIHTVEPSLPKDRPVAILDYPAFVPCLAKNKGGNDSTAVTGKTKERWELYLHGIELANCFSEETDPEQIRRFFEEETRKKEQDALVRHSINPDYWKIFLSPPECQPVAAVNPQRNPGFPPCSGVALGLDRLIMAFTGKTNIESVVPFPF